MAFKAWFLLILFLLQQTGALVASAGESGISAAATGGSACAATSCCCAEGSDQSPVCACAEAPSPEEQPSPAMPPAPATGRDLLPAPVWIEVRTCERPRWASRPAMLRPRLRATPFAPSVPVALTVRFCAFLI